MIQSILSFVLGFLCAGLLALLIAPPIWRRAVNMTRKRMQASVPLTLSDIQAEKDRLRAEFAMSTRRLEMNFKQFREKAAAQMIEISRNREELKGLARERDGKNDALTDLEAKAADLRNILRDREAELQHMIEKLAAAEQSLRTRSLELDKLGRMYEDATFSSSSRQIELVARESEVERLNDDVSVLRTEHKETVRRLQALSADNQLAGEALQSEKKRVLDLEQSVQRTLATLAEREDSLGRSEQELARLREMLKSGGRKEDDLNAQLISLQSDKLAVEAQHADLSIRMSKLLENKGGGEDPKSLERLSSERAVLEDRLTTLTRENRKLKDEIGLYKQQKPSGSGEQESGRLRQQMNELAAEVIRLTALLDGPDSPIEKALSVPGPRSAGGGATAPSLADRVRALQKASAG